MKYPSKKRSKQATELKSAPHDEAYEKAVRAAQRKAARAAYRDRVKDIMQHLEGVHVIGEGPNRAVRLTIRDKDGNVKTVDVLPKSDAAIRVARQLMVELYSVRQRVDAWRMLMSKQEESRIGKIIGHLNAAEALISEKINEDAKDIATKKGREAVSKTSAARES